MDDRPIDTLNVIPFVDIMLVLLTIVLTTASFISTGRIPITLPEASQTRGEKREDKIIEITTDGSIYLDGAPASKDELQRRIGTLPAETSFLIRADRDATFQKFIDVADILKKMNFSRVAVQTQTVSRSR